MDRLEPGPVHFHLERSPRRLAPAVVGLVAWLMVMPAQGQDVLPRPEQPFGGNVKKVVFEVK